MNAPFVLTGGIAPRRPAKQAAFAYPQPFTEKYQPARIDDFAGLDLPKAVLLKFSAAPYPSAWFFIGKSGTGKTTMAHALAAAIGGEVHHVPSRKCDLGTVESTFATCAYVPMGGGWHFVLVDEADQMTHAAQLAFLSRLDGTAPSPQTIILFTGNSTAGLEDRFLSRCRMLTFDADGLAEPALRLLASVWRKETKVKPDRDALRAILESSNNNLRDALMRLEVHLLAPEFEPVESFAAQSASSDEAAVSETGTTPASRAALKAWETRRLSR